MRTRARLLCVLVAENIRVFVSQSERWFQLRLCQTELLMTAIQPRFQAPWQSLRQIYIATLRKMEALPLCDLCLGLFCGARLHLLSLAKE